MAAPFLFSGETKVKYKHEAKDFEEICRKEIGIK